MASSTYSFRDQIVGSLLRTKRPDVPLGVAIRNTAAVVLPLGIGMASGHTAIGLGIGAGALDTMFSDQPGPYRQRISRLLLASLAACLASLCGFQLGTDLLPMLAATLACGFFGGLLVVFGTDIARVGMTSMILLVITAAEPIPRLADALGASLLIFAGGLLLALFSVAAWPLQRYGPERMALGGVYRGLAALARQTAHDHDDAPALTDAMTGLQQTLLGRHRAHGRAMEAFGVLLELAERIRLELVAIVETHAEPSMHATLREDTAQVLEDIAAALDAGESPARADLALQQLRAHQDTQDSGVMTIHAHALSGQLAAAIRNADWAGSRGEVRAAHAELRLPRALRGSAALATLRANLSMRSVAFRHALRCAVCLSTALLISRLWQLPHGYWLPMTVAIVLRPDFAATFNFGLLRVVGTVLGLVLTTTLLFITPDQPWAHLALMALLCMAFRYLATAHYGIAVATLTGTVVILLSFEGVASGTAVVDRAINTALGSGMALLAYVVWPTWERSRARSTLANMLDAYANYLTALASPTHRDAHREARTAARTARTNAQASLDRMRAEPATPASLLELASALFANGNRLARTAMTLEAFVDERGQGQNSSEIAAFVMHAATALHEIAGALRDTRRPGALPDLRTEQRSLCSQLDTLNDPAAAAQLERISDRLTDNVNTLAYVVGRQPSVPAG
ncbi:FUSC family protein [Dyella sp. A6]|uniref:FUSC family protein n=1 Tax=Dyella aluminiiresistens TaxID=3069105 RepID=UPI002E79C2C0|nr:FUSC family protein [Dyella sp. A6]